MYVVPRAEAIDSSSSSA